MGRKVSILHVASFIGNVGDNASHAGFYRILNKIIGSYEIEQLEMRKFYLNYTGKDKKVFDKTFIDYANSFDLVVFGGGGFLDYWIPGSPSGTTIGIAPEIVKDLRTRVLITSMGSLPKKDIPPGNIDKYKNFLDKIFDNGNIRLAIRNDGSKQAIKDDLGDIYSSRIDEVLDSGFFYTINREHEKLTREKYIAINVATDQVELLSNGITGFSAKQFYEEIKLTINKIIHGLGMHVILVPHVYGDLLSINSILDSLNDYDLRNAISIGPCVQGERAANIIFSIYKNSNGIIASRLHANVCGMAMNKNVIGLPVLNRIKSIHESLGSKQFVSVQESFSDRILKKLGSIDLDLEIKKTIELKKAQTFNFYEKQLGDLS